MTHFIPEQLDDLTPEWLTTALRSVAVLSPAGRVASVEREPLGEGEGFMGVIARLRLTYEGGEGPATMVAKVPRFENVALGESVGAYERECSFYEEFADDFPIAIPRMYYCDFDREASTGRERVQTALATHTPSFLLPAMLRLAIRAAGRRKRRYLLLIEDLGDAAPVDQVAGGSVGECASVLTEIAKMHAAFWDDAALAERPWLTAMDADSRVRQALFRSQLSAFREEHAAVLDDHFRDCLAWIDRYAVRATARMQEDAPATLLHGDLRLDNLMYRGETPIFYDWQAMKFGAAAFDVSYFLSGASSDLTDADEEELTRLYHTALLEQGVRGYPFEAFERHYRIAMLLTVRILINLRIVDFGEGRGLELAHAWTSRLRARIGAIDLNSVSF